MENRKAVTEELLQLGFNMYSIEQAYQMHAWVNGDIMRNVQKMTDIILQSQHVWNNTISSQTSNRKRKLSESNCNSFEPETKRMKLSNPNQEDIFYDDMIHLFNDGKISYSHSKKDVRKILAEKYGLNEKELKRNKDFNAAIKRIINGLASNLEIDTNEVNVIDKPTEDQSLRELKAELNSRSGGCPIHGLGHHLIFKQKAIYLEMYCNLCEDILIQQIELPLKLRDGNNGENDDDANANKMDQEKQSEKIIMKQVKKNKDLNEWNCHEIIHWINRVDHGKLNDIKYQCLKKQIKIGNIKGYELSNINDTALKLIGIKDVKDRKLILNYIFDLISNNNNNDNDNGVDMMSIDICGDVPDSYLCPISYEIMRDPVLITISAHTYERQVIEKYVKENKIDPITLQKVEMKHIVPNRALKESIQIWRSKNINNHC